MITKIRIENFKSYKNVSDFKLARLTFIYGDNSVGKSSFFQALRLIDEKYTKFSNAEHVSVAKDELDRHSFKRQGFVADTEWKIRIVRAEDAHETVWTFGRSADSDDLWILTDDQKQIVTPNEYRDFIPDVVHMPAIEVSKEKNGLASIVDELTSEQKEHLNGIFDKLNIGYEYEGGDLLKDLLLDMGGIHKNDVGTGVQGLLRQMKRLVKWNAGLLMLEEPESNLNENQLQGLAALLIREVMSKKDGNTDAQLFVECHSEHMLLELIKSVYRGDFGITNKDVQVIYVSKDETGSHVFNCEMNEKGTIAYWPDSNGFFTARRRIAFN